MRQAILAHAGEALEQQHAFRALGEEDQDGLMEFLKSQHTPDILIARADENGSEPVRDLATTLRLPFEDAHVPY